MGLSLTGFPAPLPGEYPGHATIGNHVIDCLIIQYLFRVAPTDRSNDALLFSRISCRSHTYRSNKQKSRWTTVSWHINGESMALIKQKTPREHL